MKLLEEKILKDGKVYPGKVLKVGAFLNHQIDVPFLMEVGREFYNLFKDEKITKIITIESSGIAIACLAATFFDVPVVFAKKTQTLNISDDVYSATVHSYTHNNDYTARIERQYLSKEDRVLIIDDFLANGAALIGLTDMVAQSGASLAGCGIVIEKLFQGGGDMMREKGVRVESLAKIESMTDDGKIVFA